MQIRDNDYTPEKVLNRLDEIKDFMVKHPSRYVCSHLLYEAALKTRNVFEVLELQVPETIWDVKAMAEIGTLTELNDRIARLY